MDNICTVFIEHANYVRDTVLMVEEKVTDRHSSFTLGIKVPGVGPEGEFPFPDLKTILILRYRLFHRKLLLSRGEHWKNLQLSGGFTRNNISYRPGAVNLFVSITKHRDSCR